MSRKGVDASFMPFERARIRTARWFLVPVVSALALVAGWPLLRTVGLSLSDATLVSLDTARFVGLSNFRYLVGDPDWWQAVRNTLLIAAWSVGIETILGVVVALVLNRAFAGRGAMRAAVLVPWAIPTIVSAKMWAWMLNDLYGIVNAIGMRIGVLPEPIAWTADARWSLIAVVAVDVWKTTPFMALLVLAALQTLPRECYEAARIDGVGPFRLFFRVTLPLIRPALIVAVIFRTLDALRIFDLVYVLTPNNTNTMTMSTYARQQLIDFQDVAVGSAAATLIFGTIALVTAVYLTGLRASTRGEGGW